VECLLSKCGALSSNPIATKKLFKSGGRIRKSNREGKFDQSTLYTCMDNN
jgi:hypothetical protein